jgi:GNAT superfamily N-acetyltransferase
VPTRARAIREHHATFSGGASTVAWFAHRHAWRRRGIAEAIKRAHIRWTKANGLRVLRTANEVRIPAIRRLNERYGYRPEPAEIVMRGLLAGQQS